MDIQRVLILLGLAVTSYMLILAWNEDYGQVTDIQAPELVDTPIATLPSQPTVPVAESAEIVPRLEDHNVSVKPVTVQARKVIQVETDVLKVQIDLLGGDIVSVALPQYPMTLETPDIPFLLVNPGNSYVVRSGLIGPNGTDKQGFRPLFSTTRNNFNLGDGEDLTVTLRYVQPDGVEVLKHFLFRRGDYLIGMKYEINNYSTNDWRAGLFVQIKRDAEDPVSVGGNSMGLQPYVGGATRSDEELYRKLEFDDIEDESYKLTREDGYVAMVQHYFVSAWIPSPGTSNTYQARKLKNQDVYLFGFTTPAISVPAGANDSVSAQFYVGPKDQYRLRDIASGLDLTVDYGFLWWLAQPLFYLLTVIHSVVGNWGLAIIGLTVIVKSLLYPLSAASFRSMAKMRKLQPEMARLKERFGEDRQQFSQAMMDLYKKEGANPLGGCFPILLQMPVFLALYWTLMESVELRQAPFFLWIHDLSAMDPYFILPIAMGISMYLTQMMQPEPPDPVQAKVFKLMPIMFTFFFLWFPSGLVLYWLVNNILSLLQQLYVTRQLEKAT